MTQISQLSVTRSSASCTFLDLYGEVIGDVIDSFYIKEQQIKLNALYLTAHYQNKLRISLFGDQDKTRQDKLYWLMRSLST